MATGRSVGRVNPTTLGELRASGHVHKSVKAEIRDNVVNYVSVVTFTPPRDRTLRPEMTTAVRIDLDQHAGALVVFEGIVLPREDGRPITALDYEAYQPMAATQLRRLGEEMVRRHGLLGLSVEHSRGRIRVGECSFRLRIASRHRPEALRATEQFIDRLKRDVPIWKTAVFAD